MDAKHVAETHILSNRGVGDALLGQVNDAVGQQDALPATLEGPVGKGIDLDLAPDGAAGRSEATNQLCQIAAILPSAYINT